MKNRQSGATVIEFALVLIIYLMFLLGILDFSRMMFTWSAANEATRAGARYAVVCDSTANQADVLARMQGMLPQISDIDLAWDPAGCTTATCQGVNVTITGLNFHWLAPVPSSVARTIPMPGFSTYLPREAMRQDRHSGALCTTTPGPTP